MESISTPLFGLASAISWGAGDFSGGIATKKNIPFLVVFVSQFVGGLLLAILGVLLGEPVPAGRDVVFGAVAGVMGMLGLVALYQGLAGSRMGLMAPLTAVMATIVPMPVAFWRDG